jgi:hypothetical protein
MTKKEATNALLILFISYLILLFAFTWWGLWYTRLCLPIFQWALESFPGFDVPSVWLAELNSKPMIFMDLKFTQNTVNGPSATFTAVLHWNPTQQYLHPILLFSILAAWPKLAFKDRLKVFGIGLPLLLIVELIDIPLRTVTQCHEDFRRSISQGTSSAPALFSYWVHFLESGGRKFLSVLAACLAVGCFYLYKVLRTSAPHTKDPCPCGSGKIYKRCCMNK